MINNVRSRKLNVLVTRSRPSGEVLCEKIAAAGGHAIYFPTIEIAPVPHQDINRQIIAILDQYDYVIFLSPHAVLCSLTLIQKFWTSFPDTVKVAAVGEGTANALRAANIAVQLVPREDWSSEGLLDLPQFQHVPDKKIAIFQGKDGRNALIEPLERRGAIVTPVIVYQRLLPNTEVDPILDLLRRREIDMMVITSGVGLENLEILLGAAKQQLREVPLLVVGLRVKKLAETLGFKKIFSVKNANHETIIQFLTKQGSVTRRELAMENSNHSDHHPTHLAEEKSPPDVWKVISTCMAGIILLVVIGAIGYGYYRLTGVGNYFTDTILELRKNQDLLARESQQQQDAIKNLEKLTQNLQEAQAQNKLPLNKDEPVVLEAQYLVKMANDQLQMTHNVAQVTSLLQTANQLLQGLNDPQLSAVSTALQTDIAAFENAPKIDINRLYFRLTALDQQVEQLPWVKQEMPEPLPVVAGSSSWWQRGLQHTGMILKQIVVVQHIDRNQLPFITPTQKDFLYQNLHAMFEKATWGLLHQQEDIYRDGLQQISTWVRRYFAKDSPDTQLFLTNITELQQEKMNAVSPLTISASIQAFQEYFKNRTQQ